MSEARLRRIHWWAGVGTLLLFVLTGAYMRWVHQPPVKQLDDATRAVYRSRHIFILLAGLANLARAAGMGASASPTRTALLASVIVMAAPLLLTAGFFTEPPMGVNGRSYSTPALYSLFGAALILAHQGRR